MSRKTVTKMTNMSKRNAARGKRTTTKKKEHDKIGSHHFAEERQPRNQPSQDAEILHEEAEKQLP